MTEAVAAVDLGATSGRVMLGYVGHNELSLRPVARFPNGPVATADGLRWNLTGLYRHLLSGLDAAIREETNVQSIGIDSWAVDYALLSGDRMLAEPFHYRDERTVPAVAAVHELVGAADLYRANGLQHLPFNTLFQLTADRLAGTLDEADGILLIPDLLGFWLTGVKGAELTNASTTGLLSVTTRGWDDVLMERLCLPRSILLISSSREHSWDPQRDLVGCRSPRSDRTTPHRPSSPCPRLEMTSPTFPAEPGGWWGSSWRVRCSRMRAG